MGWITEARSTYMSLRRNQSSPVIPSEYSLRRRLQWSTTSNECLLCIKYTGHQGLRVFLTSEVHSERTRAASIDEEPVVKPFCRRDCDFSRWALGLLLRLGFIIATDKRGYPHNIFLISPQKHMLWVLIRSAWKKCLICCCVPSVVLRSLLLPGSCQGLSSLRFWGLGLSTLFWALEELASPRKCNSQGSVDRSQHTVHRISDARSSGPCNPQLCVAWGGRGCDTLVHPGYMFRIW